MQTFLSVFPMFDFLLPTWTVYPFMKELCLPNLTLPALLICSVICLPPALISSLNTVYDSVLPTWYLTPGIDLCLYDLSCEVIKLQMDLNDTASSLHLQTYKIVMYPNFWPIYISIFFSYFFLHCPYFTFEPLPLRNSLHVPGEKTSPPNSKRFRDGFKSDLSKPLMSETHSRRNWTGVNASAFWNHICTFYSSQNVKKTNVWERVIGYMTCNSQIWQR